MTSSEDASSEGADGSGYSIDAFLEAKLHWPRSRPTWLHRERLLARVQEACTHPVTLVAAPAGYGKTILLAQWLTDASPRAAWVSLDPGDNDPTRLWTHVAAALERAGCAPASRHTAPRPAPRTATAAAPSSLLRTIVDGLHAMAADVLLVLDDFHFVRQSACHEQVEYLVEHLPPQAHLVILTRADPGLRLGRLRASAGLLEIRAAELAFTTDEARILLGQHVGLSQASVELLMARTEGWPAGLYLASLSLADRPDADAFVRDFSGGNRYIGDYLTEEVLSRHPDGVREFITTVSILDRFSAELCDHVADRTGSAAILRDLERSNLFLVPLDGDGHWYRFHHLFAAVARGELEVTRPREVAALHARAAEWFGARGNVDEAVQHALAAGDLETAALLVQGHWLQFVDADRTATVDGWLRAIGPPQEASEPAASVTAAWVAALIGDETTLADRLAALEAVRDQGPLPDGSHSVGSAVAMIHGLFGYGGPVEMLRGAERAVLLETDQHSPFYALAQVALGHAAYVMGDLAGALNPLANARHSDRAPVVIRALALATEALVEDERGQRERSRECAELAVELLGTHGLRAVPQASLAYTALGRVQAVAGHLDEALTTLERALVLRRETSAHGPWGMVHHLLVHAGVAAEAGRPDLARELLAELDSRLARFTDGMAATQVRAAAVRGLVRADGDAPAGDPLTDRETDILRFLQGSLSLPEIAGELYVSSNTVKTHARAVYRKLGVHTRAEAVTVARRHGLL